MTEPAPRLAPLWVTVLLAVLGVVFLAVSIIYFARTAEHLPTFFPGHQAGSGHVHVKHGLASGVLALLCFVGAAMTSGRKHPIYNTTTSSE